MTLSKSWLLVSICHVHVGHSEVSLLWNILCFDKPESMPCKSLENDNDDLLSTLIMIFRLVAHLHKARY